MEKIHKAALEESGLPCNDPYTVKLLLKIIGGDDFVQMDGGWRDFFLIDSNPKKKELLQKKTKIKEIIKSIFYQFDVSDYKQTNDTATMKLCLKKDADLDQSVPEYVTLLFDADFWPDTWGEGDICLDVEYAQENDEFPTNVYELTPVLLSISK